MRQVVCSACAMERQVVGADISGSNHDGRLSPPGQGEQASMRTQILTHNLLNLAQHR